MFFQPEGPFPVAYKTVFLSYFSSPPTLRSLSWPVNSTGYMLYPDIVDTQEKPFTCRRWSVSYAIKSVRPCL